MKHTKILLIFAFSIFYFIFTFTLSADTIIDSVYSTPELDGDIFFSQNNQSFTVYILPTYMGPGDIGMVGIWPDPNSRYRSYASFELPQIPDGYEVDSVYIRLYQSGAIGNEFTGFPIWNVPGGDTMFCIMDHIDYGDYLDSSDWTKGDPGDYGTLHTNIGIISDSAEVGYRYLDITTYVLDDYNNRDKTQYRIRFPIETDWDYLGDGLFFITSDSDFINHRPIMYIYFEPDIAIDSDTVVYMNDYISIYPNPFCCFTTIKFNTYTYTQQGLAKNQIKIYNIKGKLVKCISAAQINWKGGENKVIWDGRDENDNVVSNGIYLIKIECKDVNVIKKVIKLK